MFREKAAGTKRQTTRIFPPKEKSAWEMTRQFFTTVAQANGQTVERRVKVKETTLDQAAWERLLLRIMGEQEDRCALTGLPFVMPMRATTSRYAPPSTVSTATAITRRITRKSKCAL